MKSTFAAKKLKQFYHSKYRDTITTCPEKVWTCNAHRYHVILVPS